MTTEQVYRELVAASNQINVVRRRLVWVVEQTEDTGLKADIYAWIERLWQATPVTITRESCGDWRT